MRDGKGKVVKHRVGIYTDGMDKSIEWKTGGAQEMKEETVNSGGKRTTEKVMEGS